jgi:addiction module antidote protein, HigA family
MSDSEKVMAPTHPGVILREEFLDPMRITDYQLAKEIGVPQTRISAITHGQRRISADTGLRLSRYLGMSEGFWTGLQEDYDREITKDQLGATLDDIRPIAAAS